MQYSGFEYGEKTQHYVKKVIRLLGQEMPIPWKGDGCGGRWLWREIVVEGGRWLWREGDDCGGREMVVEHPARIIVNYFR